MAAVAAAVVVMEEAVAAVAVTTALLVAAATAVVVAAATAVVAEAAATAVVVEAAAAELAELPAIPTTHLLHQLQDLLQHRELFPQTPQSICHPLAQLEGEVEAAQWALQEVTLVRHPVLDPPRGP